MQFYVEQQLHSIDRLVNTHLCIMPASEKCGAHIAANTSRVAGVACLLRLQLSCANDALYVEECAPHS